MPACQAIVKKAIAARLGERYGLEQLPETGALYQVQFSIMKDTATLMLDTSGPGLHKRGYRAVGVTAPLRETLAAALVLLSRYRGRDPFCDPFCGSGTIAIEAALIAKNRPRGCPGPSPPRSGRWLDAKSWLDAADEAMDREFGGTYDIWGGDVDPKAVEIARANAVKADVEDLVRFETADAAGSGGIRPMAGSSPIRPMENASWRSGRRRNFTAHSAGQYVVCRRGGA